MCTVLGYDHDEREIYEYSVLRAIWSNDIDIAELEDADPRQYCALIAEDGKAYAISVFDSWNEKLIREREHIEKAEIPTIVKPIEDMTHYELAYHYDYNGLNFFTYDFDHKELKEKLNTILRKSQMKRKLTLK